MEGSFALFPTHNPTHKMLHTVEVTGSNPVAPTIESITYRPSCCSALLQNAPIAPRNAPQIMVLCGNPIHPDRHMGSRDHAVATRYGPGSRAPMHRALRRESSAPAAVAPAASLRSAPAYRPRG